MDIPDIDAQGRRMLRRAASPGVTHGGLAVPRPAIGAGASLGAEIQRRWTPADAAGWGNGPALHYAGQAPAGGPAVPAVQAAGSAPRARVVGQAASPAAQAVAPMGAGVQRQHLGTTVSERTPGTARTARTGDAAPMPVVRRKAAETPAVQRQAVAAAALPVAAPPVETAPVSSPAPATVLGPAIVRRSAAGPAAPPAPAMPLRQPAPGSLSREAGEGRGGGAPTTPVAPAAPATSVLGPAIVRRSTGSPAEAPVQRRALPTPGAALPLPTGKTRVDGGGAAIVQARHAESSAPPPAAPSLTAAAAGLAMPLARSAAPASSAAATSGGVIQRQAIGGDLGEAAPSPEAPAPESVSLPAAGSTAAAPDIDEVVDRVMRRLTRTLAVESERHGGRRWP